MTFAPRDAAMSRVASVEFESTTTISSAQATDSQAALIFDSSLNVMIVAVIFIRSLQRLTQKTPQRNHAELYGSLPFLFFAIDRIGVDYGSHGRVSTITLLARNVVEVARCKSASALL